MTLLIDEYAALVQAARQPALTRGTAAGGNALAAAVARHHRPPSRRITDPRRRRRHSHPLPRSHRRGGPQRHHQ